MDFMNQNEANEWDAVVVGGGPAGLSAALMLGRSQRRVLVVDGGQPRNRFAAHMHGVLGNEGVSPAQLLDTGRQECSQYGVEFIEDSVVNVEESTSKMTVTTQNGQSHVSRAVVISTGIVDRLLEIPGLQDRWGKDVLHCPYCHGWEVRGQRLGVIGTNAMAVHQVQLVRQLSSDVTLFTQGEDFVDADTLKLLASRHVKVISTPVQEVQTEGDELVGVDLVDGSTVELDAIFTAAMPEFRDEFLANLNLEREDSPVGSVISRDAMAKTSNSRIWIVGNVIEPFGNVPMSIGAGSFVGASVNATLVSEDFELAARQE